MPSVSTLRDRLKKQAARRLGVPVNSLNWKDGALCYSDGRPVDGVPIVPKEKKNLPIRVWMPDR